MNYIKHLTGFFDRAANDRYLNSTHISIYMSIFQLWNVNRFKNPISLSRSELMGLSKVSSKTTYHKCMRELQDYGYLRYEPSYHPLRGSWVYLFDLKKHTPTTESKFCPGTGLVLDRLWTSAGLALYKSTAETDAGKVFQAPLNIYKHIKHNKLFFYGASQDFSFLKKEKNNIRDGIEKILEAENAFDVKKNRKDSVSDFNSAVASESKIISKNISEKNPSEMLQVVDYFISSGYPEAQAVKFFHFYKATGWKIGGKSLIENWHSAAHSWMLNENNSNSNGRLHRKESRGSLLHSNSNKDYSEPL